MGRLTEIDALKRNLSPVFAALETGDSDCDVFHERLDALVEARNISLGQIAAVGDLIETAFQAGRRVAD